MAKLRVEPLLILLALSIAFQVWTASRPTVEVVRDKDGNVIEYHEVVPRSRTPLGAI